MSNADALQKRCRSLENAFFSDLDQKLLTGLKEKLDMEAALVEFRNATGIQDTKVLESLYSLGVTPAALAAMRAFPLIAVAWADGETSPEEIATVRMIADRHFKRESAAGELIDRWLAQRPTPEMLDAWEICMATMIQAMPASEAESIKQALIEEINEVATASGGLLGWGAISHSEKQTMQRIKAALE